MIFEINPRFSGTTPIREKFGLNEYTAISKTLFSRQKFYYKLKKKFTKPIKKSSNFRRI